MEKSTSTARTWEDREEQILTDVLARALSDRNTLVQTMRRAAGAVTRRKHRRQLLRMADQIATAQDPAALLQSNAIPEPWIPALLACHGRPGELLRTLTSHATGSPRIRVSLFQSLLYFLIVALIASFLLSFLLIVSEAFASLYQDFEMKLPLSTLIVVELAALIERTHGLIMLVPLLTLVGAAFGIAVSSGHSLEKIVRYVPVVGPAYRLRRTAQFVEHLAAVLRIGAIPTDALRVAGRVCRSKEIHHEAHIIADSLESAQPDALMATTFYAIPAKMVYLLHSYRATDTLEPAVRDMARLYSQQIQPEMTSMYQIMSEVGTILAGITVGLVIISVVLPFITLVCNLS